MSDLEDLQDIAVSQSARGHPSHASHCKNGHEFTAENTRIRKRNGRKWRVCRDCDKDRLKRRILYNARSYPL